MILGSFVGIVASTRILLLIGLVLETDSKSKLEGAVETAQRSIAISRKGQRVRPGKMKAKSCPGIAWGMPLCESTLSILGERQREAQAEVAMP